MKVLKMLTSEDMKRIQAQADLALLIEHYKKEIWEWKQKESKWISDKNLLEGSKKTIDEIATKLVELSKDNAALKKRAEEAEGENTIIKGIGNNSPEMKALQKEVEELKVELAEEEENHQYDNLVHTQELKKALEK